MMSQEEQPEHIRYQVIHAGLVTPYISHDCWLLHQLEQCVLESFGDLEGIGVLDETGIRKYGMRSVEVVQHYCGAVGKLEICQVATLLTYASVQREVHEMGLNLYMLGLVVRDMKRSLEFYRRLGLDIPDGSEGKTHVQIPMGNGLTFFLDSNPAVWDPGFASSAQQADTEQSDVSHSYRSILEFYLKTQAEVDRKYSELTSLGYQGLRAPYRVPIPMQFALIADPDGNTILLSGDIEEQESTQASGSAD